MAISESRLEKRLIRALKKRNVKNIKGDSTNNVGFPDRIIFNHLVREIHYVELKNDTYYKQTIPQKKWQEIILNAGGRYFLLNGDDDVNAYIRNYVIIQEQSIFGTQEQHMINHIEKISKLGEEE